MNRRLWTAVAGTVTVLGGVSFIWGPGQVEKALHRMTDFGLAALAALDALPWSAVGALAAGAAVLGLLGLRSKRRRRVGDGEPWRIVVEMGKQGRSPSAIARETGLPQDAVRIVLAPVAVDPSFPRGNSFRPPRSTPSQPRNSTPGRGEP